MTFSHMEFAWLALALPAIALALIAGQKLRLQARRVYGSENLLSRFHKRKSSKTGWVHPAGLFLASVLLVVAALGPVANTTPKRVPDGSVQAVVVLDVSKSMAAEDYREFMPADAGLKPDLNEPWGSRLDMAKYQMLQIMKKLSGSQLGIVNYAEKGFPQADLTGDFLALDFVIKNWVALGNAPGTGSHYDKGLAEALATFKRDEDASKKKVIILISDGGFDGDAGELAKVVEEINKQKIKVVIIGVGMPGQNAIPVYENGKLSGYMKVDEQTVTTSYEEDNLRQLALATGGVYHHVDTTPESQKLTMDELANDVGGYRIEMTGTPLFPYFGGAALAVIVILSAFGYFSRNDL